MNRLMGKMIKDKNGKTNLARLAGVCMLTVIFLSATLWMGIRAVKSSPVTFNQADWSGGSDGGSYATQTGWTKYDKTSTQYGIVGSADIRLGYVEYSVIDDNFPEYPAGTSGGDFDLGFPTNTDNSNGTLKLLAGQPVGHFESLTINLGETKEFATVKFDGTIPNQAAAAAQRDPNKDRGIVSLYHMEETATAFTDSIGGNTLTWYWGAGYSPTPKFGANSALFDIEGSGDYMQNAAVTNFPGTAVSVEAWIKITTRNNGYIVNYNWSSVGSWILYESTNGNIYFQIFDGAAKAAYAPITTGVWHHVVGTYSQGGVVNIYIDGVKGTPSATSAGTLLTSGSIVLSNAATNANVYVGYLDELAIYNRALSLREVQDHYRGQAVQFQVAAKNVDTGWVAGDFVGPDGTVNTFFSPPLGLWHFNTNLNTDTTTSDATGRGMTGSLNVGTLGNINMTVMWSSNGKLGSTTYTALDFDGLDDYVQVTDPGTLSPLDLGGSGVAATLEAWVNPDGTATDDVIIAKNLSYSMAVRSGTLQYNINRAVAGVTGWINTGLTVSPGQWSHVALTYDGTTVTGYVNAVADATPDTYSADSLSQNDWPVCIGSMGTACVSSGNHFNGRIGDVAIYDYVLPPEGIMARYNLSSGTEAFHMGGIPAAFDNLNQYVRYRTYFSTPNTAYTTAVDKIYVGFLGRPSSSALVSSLFDTGAIDNTVQQISWNENVTLPLNTTVTVSLQSAADSVGPWSAYSVFTSSGCSKDGAGLVTCATMPLAFRGAEDDRWLRYKATLTSSDGLNTATVDNIGIVYDTPIFNVKVSGSNSLTVDAAGSSSATVTARDSTNASDVAGYTGAIPKSVKFYLSGGGSHASASGSIPTVNGVAFDANGEAVTSLTFTNGVAAAVPLILYKAESVSLGVKNCTGVCGAGYIGSTASTDLDVTVKSLPNTLSAAYNANNNNRQLTITFDAVVDVTPASNVDLSKVSVRTTGASSGGVTLTGAAVTETDGTTITITTTEAQRVAIQALTSREIDLDVGAFLDIYGNATDASADTVISYTPDTTAPTVILSDDDADNIVRDANTVIITAAFSEAMTVSPAISIDVSGGTGSDINGAVMTQGADATIWTYSWNVPAGNDGATAAVTVAGTDMVANTYVGVDNIIYTIDNTAPGQPVGLSFTAAGGTVVADYVNSSNTGFTVSFTSPASQYLSTAHLYVGGADFTTPITTAVGTASSPYILTGNAASITQLGADGAKILTVVLVDTAGNETASANINITKDTTAPTVSLSSDDTDGFVKDADTVVITATFSESMTSAPTTSVDVSGGTGSDINGAVMTQGANATIWTYSWNVPAGNNGATATVTVTGTDLAANVYAGSNNIVYTIDNVAPNQPTGQSFTATGGTVVPAYVNSSNTGFTVSFTSPATEFAGTAHLYLGVADFTTPITTTVSAASTGYVLTGNAASITQLGADGSKILTVVIIDTAGNVGTVSSDINITKDKIAPTVSLSSNDPDGFVKNADTVVITATFSEAMTASPTIFIDVSGGTLQDISTAMTPDVNTATWTYTWDVPAGNNGETAGVSVAGTDLGSNAYAGSNNIFYTIDNVAPNQPTGQSFTATGGIIVANYVNSSNTGFTVSFTSPATEFAGTAHLYLGVADFATPITTTVSTASTGYVLTGNAASITQLGGDGAKILTVKIIDTAGNVGTVSGDVNITKDVTVPTVSLSDDHADLIVRDADTVVVTATFSEAMTSAPTVSIDVANNTPTNVDINAAAMTMGADTTIWTYSWNVPAGHSAETATVTVAGNDIAGSAYTGLNNIVYTIDNTLPTVSSVGLNPASPFQGNTITFTVNLSEDTDTSVAPVVKFGLNSPYTNNTITPKSGAGYTNGYQDADHKVWEGTASSTVAGNYTFSISAAKDPAGNEMAVDTAQTFMMRGFNFSAPVSGTIWGVGTIQTIQWASFGMDAATLSLKYESGGNWYNVQNSLGSPAIAVSGTATTQEWKIPPTLGITFAQRVQIFDNANSSTDYKISDNFSISGNLVVDSPTTSSKWSLGTAHTIQWTGTGTFSSGVKLEYYNGSSWQPVTGGGLDNAGIAGTIVSSSGGSVTKSFAWTPSDEGITTGYNTADIRVSDANTLNPPSSDPSGSFTIAGVAVGYTPPDRTNTAVRVGATSQNISWTHAGASYVRLQYYSNASSGYVDIPGATALAAGSSPYAWTVPDDVGVGNVYVKAIAVGVDGAEGTSGIEGSVSDVLNTAFTIYGSLNLTSTYNGATYEVNKPTNRVPIAWSGSTSIGSIVFDYTTSYSSPSYTPLNASDLYTTPTGAVNGYNWSSGTGSTYWQPPVTGGTFWVRVKDGGDAQTVSALGASGDYFQISGVSITSLSASSPYNAGQSLTINGLGAGATTVQVCYATSLANAQNNTCASCNGTNCTSVGVATVQIDDSFTQNWTVPDAISDTVYLRAENTTNTNVNNTAGPYTVKGVLTVSTPGSAWVVGATDKSVTGTVTGDIDTVDLQYTTAASPVENDWANVAAGISIGNNAGTTAANFTIPAGSFTVPDAVSASAFKIRVKDATVGRPSAAIASSAASNGFQVKGLLLATSPISSDNWYVGRTATIGYNVTGSALANLRVYYGYRKGATASNNPADYTFAAAPVFNTTNSTYFGSGTSAVSRTYDWNQVADVVETLIGSLADEQDPTVYETSGNECWLMMRVESDNADAVYSQGFRAKYYKIGFDVADYSGNILVNLNVDEAPVELKPDWTVTNWSVAPTAQIFYRYYPYSTFDYTTQFSVNYNAKVYSETVTWPANTDKTVPVRIDLQPDVVWSSKATTAYNYDTNVLNLIGWLERKGSQLTSTIATNLNSGSFIIYNSSGTQINTAALSDLTYDPNNYTFSVNWNTNTQSSEALVKGNQYVVLVTIDYAGTNYTGYHTFTLEPAASYDVRIEPVYDAPNDAILMNVSLFQNDVLVTDNTNLTMDYLHVFNASGTTDLSGNVSASPGTTYNSTIYYANWDPVGGLTANTMYTIVAKMTYQGAQYSGTKAFSVGGDVSTLSADIAGVSSQVSGVQTSIGAAADTDTASTLFGKIAEVRTRALAIQTDTGAIKTETDKIDRPSGDGVIQKINAVQATATAVQTSISNTGGLADKIGAIEAKVGTIDTNTAGLSNQITTAETNIKDKIAAERKAEIMTRSTTVKPDTSITIRFRTVSNATPTITVIDSGSVTRVGGVVTPQTMAEVSTTGIYQHTFTFLNASPNDWPTGDYTILCQDGDKTDSIVVKVQANDFDSVFAKVGAVESKLDSLTITVGTINTNTGGVSASIGDLLLKLGSFGDADAANTLFGELAAVKAETDKITANVLANLASVGTDVLTVNDVVDAIKLNLGDSTNVSGAATVFGQVLAAKGILTDDIKVDVDKITSQVVGDLSTIIANTDTVESGISGVAGQVFTVDGVVDAISARLGNTNDPAAFASVFGRIASISGRIGQKGDNYTTDTLFGQITTTGSGANTIILNKMDELQSTVTTSTADVVAKTTDAAAKTEDLAAKIGAPTDAETATTLFGRIKAGGGSRENDKILVDIKGYVDDVEKILGASTDTAESETIFGKITGMEGVLSAAGSDASNASLYAREARAQAMTVTSTMADIRAELGQGKVDSAVAKLTLLGKTMADLQGAMKKIPEGIATEGLLESVKEALDDLDGLAASKGQKGLVPALAEEFKPIDPNDISEIRNNVSGLKSLMTEVRNLLDKEVNKPIVHGWLEEEEE